MSRSICTSAVVAAAARMAPKVARAGVAATPTSTAAHSLPSAACSSVGVTDSGSKLHVGWANGNTNTFHARWLWHQCPAWIHESGQRLLRAVSFPKSPVIATVESSASKVKLGWECGHQSEFSHEWLLKHEYDSLPSPPDALLSSVPLAPPSTPRSSAVESLLAAPVALPRFSNRDVLESEDALLQMLTALVVNGACVVENCPLDPDHVATIAERVAYVQETMYGRLFEVASMEDPINVAYTNVGLDLHMDLAYYESPPGLQLLHCVDFGGEVVGGESQLLDGLEVAEYIRRHHPDEFRVLCKVPAALQKVHYDRERPVHMQYNRPHISLDMYGNVNGVFWAPPFEGTLHIPACMIDAYYDAYTVFGKAIEELMKAGRMSEFRLKPGDTMVFNNKRMLHGRSSFKFLSPSAKRVLRGCYVNIDEFHSRYQYLSHKLGQPVSPMSPMNQSH